MSRSRVIQGFQKALWKHRDFIKSFSKIFIETWVEFEI